MRIAENVNHVQAFESAQHAANQFAPNPAPPVCGQHLQKRDVGREYPICDRRYKPDYHAVTLIDGENNFIARLQQTEMGFRGRLIQPAFKEPDNLGWRYAVT